MGLSGSIESPSISVDSNIGSVVAESLRNELGREIEAAEARLRAEVDRRVQPLVQDARSRVETVQTQIADRVGAQRAEVEAMRARLEERIDALVPGAD
jgi:CRP-like cAMP-binding protein